MDKDLIFSIIWAFSLVIICYYILFYDEIHEKYKNYKNKKSLKNWILLVFFIIIDIYLFDELITQKMFEREMLNVSLFIFIIHLENKILFFEIREEGLLELLNGIVGYIAVTTFMWCYFSVVLS